MTEFTIRPAVEADVPVIFDFIRALAEYERAADQVFCDEARLRESLFGEKPEAEALLAYVGPMPAGIAVFFHNYSTWMGRQGIFLEDLFVRPEMRGHGIGKALLTTVATIARDRGCQRVEWSVLDWNQSAIDFYTSLGASPMDGWTIYRMNRAAIEKLTEG